MIVKVLGAICIMCVCAGFGFSLAYKQMKEIYLLDQWIRILQRMENEIQYRLRTIPDIFRQISNEENGIFRDFLLRTAIEMENQIQPDVRRCMDVAMCSLSGAPGSVIKLMQQLSNELGRFEVEGQICGIERVRLKAEEIRNDLNRDKTKRIRGYQTLGICAGAALVIIFI